MNVRTLITCSSLLFATMHGMDQQKPFYVTTNDEKTILVPNYIIPYFKTLKTVQEDLGNEINEIIGAPLRDYSSKKLEFVLELATILHEKKDLNRDRKSTRLNSSHSTLSRMPSSA